MPHNILTALLTGLVLFFFSGCTAQTPDLESEKATLLALHQNVLQAHLDSDVEQWMQLEAADNFNKMKSNKRSWRLPVSVYRTLNRRWL